MTKMFSRFQGLFDNAINAQARTDTIRAMHDMSDTQLAEKYGITRDEIVHYVFRDKMHVF